MNAIEIVAEQFIVLEDTPIDNFKRVDRLKIPCCRASLDSSGCVFFEQMKLRSFEGVLL